MSRCCPICLEDKETDRCERCDVSTINKSRIQAKDPWIGKTFANKYLIESRLGSGGMGVVYQARQVDMDRLVALKVLNRRTAPEMHAIQRFYREMRATTRVEHPNTVRVYDFGHTEDGEMYLAMEYLSGRTLGQVVEQDGPLPLDRTLRIGIMIAKALGAAHAQGIVHRDLKPENIFLIDVFGEPDYVKVLDFGIARFAEADDGTGGATLTTTGLIVGTPAFMSPEQAMGAPADGRSDIYSLGVVLYMMATGQVPFRGATPYVLHSHVHLPPPAPSLVAPGAVPPVLERCILKLLNKEPEQRPQSADDCITLFEQCRLELGLTTGASPRPALRAGATGVTAPKSAPMTYGTAVDVTLAADAEPVLAPSSPPPSKKSGNGVWVVLAGIVVVAAVALGWWTLSVTDDSATVSPQATTTAPTPVQPKSERPAPEQPSQPEPKPDPTPAADQGAVIAEAAPQVEVPPPVEPQPTPAAETPPPTTPQAVQRMVRVSSTPTGALVLVNGEEWGTTPLERPVDSGVKGTMEFRGEGQQSLTVPFDSDKQTDIAVVLAAVPKVTKKGAPRPGEQAVAGTVSQPTTAPAPTDAPPVEHKPVIEKWEDAPTGKPVPQQNPDPNPHHIEKWKK
ncbi:MAG: protein kinase [Myxococcales bacterium]|nr:protein kinase [Myxococcales bacterium]